MPSKYSLSTEYFSLLELRIFKPGYNIALDERSIQINSFFVLNKFKCGECLQHFIMEK